MKLSSIILALFCSLMHSLGMASCIIALIKGQGYLTSIALLSAVFVNFFMAMFTLFRIIK